MPRRQNGLVNSSRTCPTSARRTLPPPSANSSSYFWQLDGKPRRPPEANETRRSVPDTPGYGTCVVTCKQATSYWETAFELAGVPVLAPDPA